MARRVKLSAGGLNVRLHPHSPDLYDSYLQALYRLRRPVKLYGERMGMITMVNRSDIGNGVIRGIITTFTKIDLDGKWFDQDQLDDARPDAIRQINIPAHLHPNAAAFRFSLNIRKHILTFEHYSDKKYLVANSAFKLFRELSDDESIVSTYGAVKISIIQDKTSLDRIFSMTRLKSITFVIDRPNPDIWGDIEGQLDAHFDAVHAQRMEVKYTAPPGGSIVETPSLRDLGNGALRNGEIEASGYRGNEHVNLSTRNSPKIDQTFYDPEEEGAAPAFERLRRDMEEGR